MANKAMLSLLVLGLVAGSAAAHPCFGVNWFPTKASGGIDANCTSNTAPGGCAQPSVWLKSSQDSVAQTSRPADLLFSVALPDDNGRDLHRLYWAPSSDFAAANVTADACVSSILSEAAPAPARRLARKLAAATATTWTTTSGSFIGQPTASWRLLDSSNTLVPNTAGGGSGLPLTTAIKLEVPGRLADGRYCWEIQMTFGLDPTSVTTQVGNATQTLRQYADANNMTLSSNPSGTYRACFYKRKEQATASATYGMCRTGNLELNLTGVAPAGQMLDLNGTTVDGKNLVQPLLKVWGIKSRNLDGSPADQEFDQNAQNPNYIAKYFLLPLDVTNTTKLNYTLGEQMEEGYYQINAVISMFTKYQNLVGLTGVTLINQSDYKTTDVYNNYEALAQQITNGSEVGVQYGPTYISAISATPAKSSIKTGDSLTFSWSFRGVGNASCYHDNTLVASCVSPVKVQALALGSADTKHTFTVMFKDVCGRVKNASYTYTQAGITTDSKVDAPMTSVVGGTTGNTTNRGNSAEGVAAGSLRTMALSLLAALAFAALL